MKTIVRLLHRRGEHSAFHIFAVSSFLLGFFIALTAADMGPFAPLLIAIGIYAAVFSIFAEAIFWGLVLLRRITSRWATS